MNSSTTQPNSKEGRKFQPLNSLYSVVAVTYSRKLRKSCAAEKQFKLLFLYSG